MLLCIGVLYKFTFCCVSESSIEPEICLEIGPRCEEITPTNQLEKLTSAEDDQYKQVILTVIKYGLVF